MKRGTSMLENTTLLIRALVERAGRYAGESIAHDQAPFKGEMEILPILGGTGVSISFSAHGLDGMVYHQEHAVIAPDGQGKIGMWSFNSYSGLTVLRPIETARLEGASESYLLGYGEPADQENFRQQIRFDLWPDSSLSYSYAWGLPGGSFEPRSGVRLKKMA